MAEVDDKDALDWKGLGGDARAARLALALETTGLGLWEYDLSNGAVIWDARMRELFGVEAETPVDSTTYITRILPDDLPAVRTAFNAALGGADNGRYFVEHRTTASDGQQRWVRGAGRIFFDDEGRAIWALGTAQDVTDQVAARERQALLLDELNHRVKNNVAAVQAIANHTLRAHRDDIPAFREAFQSRLYSLARGHELLTRNAWATPDLAEVVESAMAPFMDASIVFDPRSAGVRIAPELAINLTLVLHELATNAAKYGALSNEDGEVHIRWTVDAEALTVEWRERGGPPVTKPSRSGFGTRLKSAALRSFGGVAESEFAPDGIICRLRVPLGDAVSIDIAG